MVSDVENLLMNLLAGPSTYLIYSPAARNTCYRTKDTQKEFPLTNALCWMTHASTMKYEQVHTDSFLEIFFVVVGYFELENWRK